MPHDFHPSRYEQASSHQRQWGTKLIEELELTGTERILDVGSGTGLLAAQLADRVPQGFVLGIDASASMVDESRKRLRTNLEFQQLDVLDAQFYEDFDLVFSNATLHWVTDHVRLLDILYQALKPGGVLRVNFAAEGNCAHFFRIVHELLDSPPYHRAFADFRWPWYMPTVEAYQDLVDAVPFSFAQVWGQHADRDFPDAESIVAWIDQPSLVPLRAHVSPDIGDQLRTEVVRRMLAETRQPSGAFHESFRRINVLARK